MPLTRIAVGNGALSPLFVGSGRAVIAGILAVLALALTHQRVPARAQWWRLAAVAAGVVYGFPLLTSYALTEAGAAHGAVVIAVLPAATAVVSAIRGRERPSPAFWAMAALGAIAAVKPGILDKFDEDKWADSYADMLGVDPELIVPSDKVALIRQQRAQAQQQAQQAAQLEQSANAAAKLASADTSGQNALTDITAAFSGYT